MGVLILLVIAANLLVDTIHLKPDHHFSDIERALEAWNPEPVKKPGFRTLFEFDPNIISPERLDSLLIPGFIKKNLLSYRSAGGKFKRAADLGKIYGMNDSIFAAIQTYIKIPETEIKKDETETSPPGTLFKGTFDPNSAGAEILSSFGFTKYQSSNLIKYREEGGFFSRPDDLLTIYGVDSTFFLRIKKNIRIAKPTVRRQSNNKSVPPKENEVEPDLTIEINTADSIDLVKLRGIGQVFAGRILKYRDLLGGFYKKEQLLEVYNLTEDTYNKIKENIWVDTLKIKEIRINFADYSELLRHPYIKRNQVEAILDYRQNNGSFRNPSQIFQAGLIDSLTFSPLRPYITCR